MKRMIAAFTVLLLSACATETVMNGIMQSWSGAKLNDAVSQWGYPNEQLDFNGRKLYVWHYNKSVTMPATTYTTGSVGPYGNFSATSTTTGGNTFQGGCDRVLEVDGNGTVTGTQWQGNNCPFLEAMEYSTWRKRSH
jgi:hypothetical protein